MSVRATGPAGGARARFLVVFLGDLRFHLTRPLFWVLLAILGASTWGLSSGGLSISSGDSTIGGQAQAWITSEFTVGMMFPLLTFLFYTFFVAIAAGMLIPQDDDWRVGPVLHATPLRPSEYVWGKFASVLVLFAIVLVLHLTMTVIASQLLPNARSELIRGPFHLVNYLRPALILAFPFVVFMCGFSFAVGELTRRPILVFVAPTAFFLGTVFFLWGWSPSWLDPTINRFLMWIEPSGFRWINETWLKVDLGVDYYNSQPIGYDLPFLMSRLAFVVLGFAGVGWSNRHFARTLRGEAQTGSRVLGGKWLRRRKTTPKMTKTRVPERWPRHSLSGLGMISRTPGFLRTVLDVARFEARNLRGEPGLYLFVFLILLMTIGDSLGKIGAFGAPLLLTPGIAAISSMNTLTLLVCLLILFYSVESVSREWSTRLAPIFYASPARTGAILTGKALANSIVGAAILVACYVGAAFEMLAQGQVAPSVGPFVLVWGLLLVPTFLAWSAFVILAFAVSGNRFVSYAMGLAAIAYTGWKQTSGEMNWVGNWNLWNAATWTDFGALDPNTSSLFLNRLFWLAIAMFLIALAVRIFPRKDYDSAQIFDRLRPANLLRMGWRMTPLALPALALGITLGVQVSQGFDGGAVERRQEEYRGRNLMTWNEAAIPDLAGVDLDVTLEPDDRWFSVRGTYEFVNRTQEPIRRLPLSVGDHFRNIEWTLNGEAFEPEDWARMHVFEFAEPLPPGGEVSIGFSHEGRFPDGISKNGGGIRQFVLPSGVALTSFGSDFVPLPGFDIGRGVDKDNRLEPRNFDDGYWEGTTPAGTGYGARFPVRTKITGPERFAYHGVGARESETVVDGRRTVIWNTDHPVSFFNIVAGEWEVWEGDGVAIYHHPDHVYNLEEMGEALQAARKYYSEWFYPYPWEELRISEFPGLASYAQGFPTNITFSESIGFLTRSTSKSRLAFMVTAHETAHQWWANLLMPGRGPGGNLLSEGMAHFSTALLFEQVHGVGARIEFCKRIEERYGDERRLDSERPLVWVDGSRAGDQTVTYDKGGWVFWMLLNHMGRENALAGIQDFIGRYVENDDYPLLQDFIAVMREHAVDPEVFDDFVDQWFYDVVVPRFRFDDVDVRAVDGGWVVHATVQNVGTGRVALQIATVRGERFPEDDAVDPEPWQEVRVSIVLGEGETESVTLSSTFEPERVVVDPDALVLMLEREQAVRELN